MNQKTIGIYIASKRKQKNLTQEQLANSIGVSNKTISKWETGKCMPDYATIPALCGALGISKAELLDGEDSAQNSLRLYDDEQTLELIKVTQTRSASNSILEAAHSIIIGVALLALSFALFDTQAGIAGFVTGLSAVVIVLGIYSAVDEARFASKLGSDKS